MTNSKIIASFFWQYGERLSVQGISFIVTLVLARLLAPAEYGIISIANVFISILEVFVISGFGNSLVQKKETTETDFSSVFYCNFALGLLLFGVMYIIAPFCSSFYDSADLQTVLRFMSFRIVIASFDSIQRAYVQRKLLFRKLFYSSLIGTSISAVFGITAAYLGMGVYALVIQYLSNAIINAVALFFFIDWRPRRLFSIVSVKQSFDYGWKLLCSGLAGTIFGEIKSFVIGGKYTPADLAFYDKGKQFPSLFYTNLNTSIGSILFPVMSRSQGDIPRVRELTRRSLQIISFVLIPVLMLLYALSEPIIDILLTSKWLPAVPFMKVTCWTFILVIPNTIFTNAINSLGRSDYHLKVEILNIVSGLAILFAVMNFGTVYIALSVTISNLICAVARFFIVRKLCQFNLRDFFQGYIKILFLSSVMMFVTVVTSNYLQSNWTKLLVVGVEGVLIYAVLAYVFCKPLMTDVKSLINGFFKKNT